MTSQPSDPIAHQTQSAPLVARLLPQPLAPYDELQGVLAWDEDEAIPQAAALRVIPPDPGPWASRFAQAVVEVMGGHRQVAQLTGWTSPAVYRDLERRARHSARVTATGSGAPQRSTLRPQVSSVHVCRLGAQVAEACVRVRHGRRSRAIALRLEAAGERWRCTAIELG